jgi:fatty acid desaturase
MTITHRTRLTTQAEYAKYLRPLLPPDAFIADHKTVWILLMNIAILILGWEIAAHLTQWNRYYVWFYLPISLVMGNSVIVLLLSTHDLMHSRMIKNPMLRCIVSLLGLSMLWTPPTFWKTVHNREHHSHTNSLRDPDRNYLYEHPASWGKWIQNLFAPSAEVHPLCLLIGMSSAWGIHIFRNLTSILLFNHGQTKYPVVSFTVSVKERWAIAFELMLICIIHLSILSYLGFHPMKLILSYFIPIWIGYGGIMFYVYTNHMLCQMTDTNDPLINSISIRVPKLFDLLHFNFSYHTEHHIFPGLNSNYYPEVQKLLKTEYGDRFHLLGAGKAWKLLLQTPRHYKNENTFTDCSGTKSVPCPLSREEVQDLD